MEKLSIIIPAHNEGKRVIGKTLELYSEFFRKIRLRKKLDFEILVVINACTDNTEEIVKTKQKKFKEIKYIEVKPPGKGLAVTKGFENAIEKDFDLIGFVDSDLSTLPADFYDLVKNIKDADGAIASRSLKKSVANFTPIRKITHWGFNFAVRSILFLKFSDTQCGAKLFRKNALQKIIKNLKTTQWAFDIDLLYNLKKSGFKIIEIPTVWKEAKGSGINLIKVPLKMFSSVVRLRLIYSPFKSIISLYDKLPERMKIHNL